jgi:hypothetical protein
VKYINTLIYSNPTAVLLLRHVLFLLADNFNWMIVAVTAGALKSENYTFLH